MTLFQLQVITHQDRSIRTWTDIWNIICDQLRFCIPWCGQKWNMSGRILNNWLIPLLKVWLLLVKIWLCFSITMVSQFSLHTLKVLVNFSPVLSEFLTWSFVFGKNYQRKSNRALFFFSILSLNPYICIIGIKNSHFWEILTNSI